MTPLIGSFTGVVLGWAMGLLSVFLVLLVLVQRGRGGGLTGALGGPGGQSAFGTKAGDMFTKITSFTALGWIALCAYTMWLLGAHPMAAVVTEPTSVEASPADETPFDANSLINPPSDEAPAGSPATLDAPATSDVPDGTLSSPAQPQPPADTASQSDDGAGDAPAAGDAGQNPAATDNEADANP